MIKTISRYSWSEQNKYLSTYLWQCCETKTNDLFFWSWWGILGIISLCSDHLLLYFRICQNRMYFARVLRPFQRVSVTGSGWFMHQHCNWTPTSRVVSAQVGEFHLAVSSGYKNKLSASKIGHCFEVFSKSNLIVYELKQYNHCFDCATMQLLNVFTSEVSHPAPRCSVSC